MAIDLSGYADAINNALKEGNACGVATQGEETPDIGFKGSMIVFDKEHLAYWERTRGEHLENLRHRPGVAVLYFSRERGKYLRMYGKAELHENDSLREEIMKLVPQPELDRDPERKGIAVLIRVDRLIEAFGGVRQERAKRAAA